MTSRVWILLPLLILFGAGATAQDSQILLVVGGNGSEELRNSLVQTVTDAFQAVGQARTVVLKRPDQPESGDYAVRLEATITVGTRIAVELKAYRPPVEDPFFEGEASNPAERGLGRAVVALIQRATQDIDFDLARTPPAPLQAPVPDSLDELLMTSAEQTQTEQTQTEQTESEPTEPEATTTLPGDDLPGESQDQPDPNEPDQDEPGPAVDAPEDTPPFATTEPEQQDETKSSEAEPEDAPAAETTDVPAPEPELQISTEPPEAPADSRWDLVASAGESLVVNMTQDTGTWIGALTSVSFGGTYDFRSIPITISPLLGYRFDLIAPDATAYPVGSRILAHSLSMSLLTDYWIGSFASIGAGVQMMLPVAGAFTTPNGTVEFGQDQLGVIPYGVITTSYYAAGGNGFGLGIRVRVAVGIGIPDSVPLEVGVDLLFHRYSLEMR